MQLPPTLSLLAVGLLLLANGFFVATEFAAQGISACLAFGVMTVLHIVLAELAPKGLALQRTEATALLVARPLQLFHALFRWPIGALNSAGNAVLHVLGLDAATGHEMAPSLDELRLLVSGMQQAAWSNPPRRASRIEPSTSATSGPES